MAIATNPAAVLELPDGSKAIKVKRCRCRTKKVDASTLSPDILRKIRGAKKSNAAKERLAEWKKKKAEEAAAKAKAAIPPKPTVNVNDLPVQNGDKKKKVSSLDDIPDKGDVGRKKSAGGKGGKDGTGKEGKEKTGKKGKKDKKGGKDGAAGDAPEEATKVPPSKTKIEYPPLEQGKWIPPDQRRKKPYKRPGVALPELKSKKWIPPYLRPKPPKRGPLVQYPPLSTKTWIPPYKRKKHKKEKPKIDYPPLTTRKWIPPYLRPRKKLGPKYIKPDGMSQKLDPSSLYKIWNEYRLFDGYAALPGHWSQIHKRYGFKTNGYQGGCNAMVSIAMAIAKNAAHWDEFDLDRILDLGDLLYEHSMLFVEDKCNPNIKLPDIYSSFYIGNTKFTMTLKGEKVSGKLMKDYSNCPDLLQVLQDFFKDNDSGILFTQNRYFGIFRQDKGYYVFDPMEHEYDGFPWTGQFKLGYCIAMRFLALPKMAEMITNNLNKEDNSQVVITPCKILRINDVNTNFPECLDEPEPAQPKEKIPKIPERVESFEDAFAGEDDDDWDLVEGEEGEEDQEDDEISGEGAELPERVVRKKPLPAGKPKPDLVSYYLELSPDRIGILRGSTHQEDPNFTKYPGTQSLENAVAAIAMLKKAKSKYWTGHIVNQILRTGEHIHHDTKKLLQPDELLTPKKVCKKIEIEEHFYTPEIEDICVIGQLQSQKLELLDLLPALQEFFRTRDNCIINGPLTLAVWQEDNVYYMFDPNERDKHGLVIIKEMIQGSQTVLIDFTPGYACVIWFSDLQDLVNVYMNNTKRALRREKFILSNVEIKDYIEPYPDWYNFKAINETKWILRALISQANIMFSKATRNLQCTGNAIMAILYTRFFEMPNWTSDTLMEILIEGDKFYAHCIEYLKNRNRFVDPMLMVDEVTRTYSINNKLVKFDIDDCIVNGLINSKDTDEKIPNLYKGLKEFFLDNDYGVVTVRNISVAVFRLKEIYYYYDSHSRDQQGYLTNFGSSCIIRCTKLDDVARHIEANLKPGLSNMFNISRIEMELWDETEDMNIRPPLGNFTELGPAAAILRADWSQLDEKYLNNAGKQTIPNLLLALGLGKMFEANDWYKELVHHIIDTGDHNYDECMSLMRQGKLNQNTDIPYIEEQEEESAPPPSVEAPPAKKGRGGGCGVIRLRGGGTGMKGIEENTENELVYLFSLPQVTNNPNCMHMIQNLAQLYPEYVKSIKEAQQPKKKKKSQRNFVIENRRNIKNICKSLKEKDDQAQETAVQHPPKQTDEILRLRGGGPARGPKPEVDNTENEIVTILTLPQVANNPNLTYQMQNFAQMYPNMVSQAKEIRNKPKYPRQRDFSKENKREIKRLSKQNAKAKPEDVERVKSASGPISSTTTLSRLSQGGTLSLSDLVKENKNFSAYAKLVEGDAKARGLMKKLAVAYPDMFKKTIKLIETLKADTKDKTKDVENLPPTEQDQDKLLLPFKKLWPFNNNQEIEKGRIRVPYKLRGGSDYEHRGRGKEPFPNYKSYSTFTDIGPLKKLYKKKSNLDEMLDYRTRLAEVLLKKTLLFRTKSRGGGDEPFEDLYLENIFEEEEKEREDITTENVVTTFKIGVNKVKITFETLSEGSIEYDLAPALLEFLLEDVPDEDHRELLLESTLLNVSIWKDNDLFFVYDPKPRDESGHVYGWDEWSEKIIDQFGEGEEMEEDFITPADMDNFAGGDTMIGQEAASVGNMPTDAGEVIDENMEMVEEEEDLNLPPPPMKMGSDFWRGKEKEEGKAFILWFTKPQILVSYLIENTPPNRRDVPYVLKKVTVVNTPDVKEVYDPAVGIKKDWFDGDWYEFKEIDHGKWILRGTVDQTYAMYPDENLGKQTVANCFVALCYAYNYAIQRFKNETIDEILKYGDRLYSFTKRLRKKELLDDEALELKEEQAAAIVEREVYSVKEVFKNFCVDKYETHVNLHYEYLVGEVNAQEFPDILDVNRALQQFFKSNRFGILCAKDVCVAIWRGEKMKYMFDPQSRGPDGTKEHNGTACITRFHCLGAMADVFLGNLDKDGNNFFAIHKISLSRNACPRIPKVEEEQKPDIISITGFQPSTPGKYILRGTISADDPTFGRGTNQFPGPIAIVALAMTLIHKSSNWSRPIVDEILLQGENLYATTLDILGFNFNPWEQKLELKMIPSDFNIGRVRVNFAVRNNDQKGIISIKNPNIPNLRVGLEKFFDENSHGVIETELLTVAVWEDEVDNFIYMLDPNPRSNTGMPQPNEGVACALCFENFKAAADHFVSLIPNDEKKQGEYTISPIEIIVGKKKSSRRRRRKKQPKNWCTQAILEKKKKEEELRRKREAERCARLGKNEYYEVPPGVMALLRGTRSVFSCYYSDYSRGFQDIPVCVVGFVMDRLLPIKHWDWKTINMILDVGDQLYKDSYLMYNPKDRYLGLEYIIRKVIIKDVLVNIQVCKPVMVNQLTLPNLEEVLEVALMRKPMWILHAADKWVLIVQREGLYFVFDPHDLDLRGNHIEEGEGCATVLRFPCIKSMSEKLFSNLFRGEDDLLFVSALGIKSFEKVAKCEC